MPQLSMLGKHNLKFSDRMKSKGENQNISEMASLALGYCPPLVQLKSVAKSRGVLVSSKSQSLLRMEALQPVVTQKEGKVAWLRFLGFLMGIVGSLGSFRRSCWQQCVGSQGLQHSATADNVCLQVLQRPVCRCKGQTYVKLPCGALG